MSLRLFLAAPGNALLEFDEPGTPTDLGTRLDAFIETHPLDTGTAQGERRLRELAQWVTLGDDVELVLEPVVDGARRTDQATTRALAVVRGTTQRVEANAAVMGRRFGMRVTTRGGLAVALGQAAVVVVPRRSNTGGR